MAERLGFGASYINCDIRADLENLYIVKIDDVQVDRVYQIFSVDIDYIITVTINLNTLQDAYESFDYIFSNTSNLDNAIALDVAGCLIKFGVTGLI